MDVLLALVIVLVMVLIILFKPIWILAPFGGEYINSSIDNNNYRVISSFDNKHMAADKLAMLNDFNSSFIDYISNKCSTRQCNPTQQKIAHNLYSRYDPDSLIENNPTSSKNTSYSQLKGKVLSICLREKITGENKIHDDNLLKFVDLHELSHVASNSYGHNDEFWHTFKQVLHDATKCDVCQYDPTNYAETPVNYCGLAVTYNPYYG